MEGDDQSSNKQQVNDRETQDRFTRGPNLEDLLLSSLFAIRLWGQGSGRGKGVRLLIEMPNFWRGEHTLFCDFLRGTEWLRRIVSYRSVSLGSGFIMRISLAA